MANDRTKNAPEYHKTMLDLINYGRIYGDYYILPTRIDTYENSCEVEFTVIDSDNKRTTVIRRGHFYDDIFTTKINNIPLTLNIRTNVLKMIRMTKKLNTNNTKIKAENGDKNSNSMGNNASNNFGNKQKSEAKSLRNSKK